MSYGAHYLPKTGTCSNTGYVSYGPLSQRGGNEALYVLSAFFVGPVAAIVGWLLRGPGVAVTHRLHRRWRGPNHDPQRHHPVGGHVGFGEVGRVADLGLYGASRHLNDPCGTR